MNPWLNGSFGHTDFSTSMFNIIVLLVIGLLFSIIAWTLSHVYSGITKKSEPISFGEIAVWSFCPPAIVGYVLFITVRFIFSCIGGIQQVFTKEKIQPGVRYEVYVSPYQVIDNMENIKNLHKEGKLSSSQMTVVMSEQVRKAEFFCKKSIWYKMQYLNYDLFSSYTGPYFISVTVLGSVVLVLLATDGFDYILYISLFILGLFTIDYIKNKYSA